MDADDKRHGSNGGYYAGCRDTCCRNAHATYRRSVWRKRYARGVDRLYIDATGTKRRIRALQALGWRFRDIDAELGHQVKGTSSSSWAHNIMSQERVHVDNATAVSEVYERLCMTFGPSRLLRSKAANWGWAVPLAWDDIDTDARPIGQRNPRANYDGRELVDEATVLRVLAGENLPANHAERIEITRRWLAMGRSERSLCLRLGWKDGRYVSRQEDVA